MNEESIDHPCTEVIKRADELEDAVGRINEVHPPAVSADAPRLSAVPDLPFYVVPSPPIPGKTGWSLVPC